LKEGVGQEKRNQVEAVLFDVDFTLIYPGPMFMGDGYRAFCERHGMIVDPSLFDGAVASAAAILDTPEDTPYDHELYVAYTRHIIEQMGGRGDCLDACAREIYAEWAACHHFELYEEVPDVMQHLAAAGIRVGLVSNSHRSLSTFASHFQLDGLIGAAVSSSEHGLMKPHPSIFRAALAALGVSPSSSLMVGDSLRHDVEGGLKAGMRAALLHRIDGPHPRTAELIARGIRVIRSLRELPDVLERND
jgi:HAD superfamily hydrolase (TIGR01662 family)